MRDSIEFDTVPYDEQCAQIGELGYETRARAEGKALIGQLKRLRGGQLPDGLSFRLKACSHDFGTYYQVVVSFDEDDKGACEAAFWLDANFPSRWDEEAKRELLGRDE